MEKSSQRLMQSLHYYDIYLSTIVHTHESLMLTVLLFIPSIMFSPKAIAGVIFLMSYHFGITYSIYYVIAITFTLLITTFTKRIFRRDRPKPRNNLTLKPMYFRSLETNFSFPSGDSAQAGVFAFFFLQAYQGDELLTLLLIFLTIVNVVLGRVYFCCHYFGDCIAGVSIGIVVAQLISQFI